MDDLVISHASKFEKGFEHIFLHLLDKVMITMRQTIFCLLNYAYILLCYA